MSTVEPIGETVVHELTGKPSWKYLSLGAGELRSAMSDNNFYSGMPWLAFEKLFSGPRLSILKVPVIGLIGDEQFGIVTEVREGNVVAVVRGWIERDILVPASLVAPCTRAHRITNWPPDWQAAVDWLDHMFPGRWGYQGRGVWGFDDPREAVQFQLAF
jgi:hypothetical protein